jgi:hypothetical protein
MSFGASRSRRATRRCRTACRPANSQRLTQECRWLRIEWSRRHRRSPCAPVLDVR